MRKFAVAAIAALSLMSFSLGASAQTSGTSTKSMALQCAVLYNLMMSRESPHERSNAMLSDQAIIMGTIYAIKNDADGSPATAEGFTRARDMVQKSLISQYQMNSDLIVDKLISCEGWREEVLIFMMEESQKYEDPTSQKIIEDVFLKVPGPKDSYSAKGASRLQISLAVDKSFAHLQ